MIASHTLSLLFASLYFIRGGECLGLPSYDKEQASSYSNTPGDGSRPKMVGPWLDQALPLALTTQIERTARLNCRVYNLGDKRVVWLRKRDVHILTIGPDVFTEDERVDILHGDSTPDWTLQIKAAHLDDEGEYECQVSTNPKISYLVNLTVAIGQVEIRGPDIVDKASTLRLLCNVTGPDPPTYLDWTLDGHPLVPGMGGLTGSRGEVGRGVTLTLSRSSGWVSSELRIPNVKRSHSGVYGCKASEAETATHSVRVVEGNQPAQLRSSNSAVTLKSSNNVIIYLQLLLLLMVATLPSSLSSLWATASTSSSQSSLSHSLATNSSQSSSKLSLSSPTLPASPYFITSSSSSMSSSSSRSSSLRSGPR